MRRLVEGLVGWALWLQIVFPAGAALGAFFYVSVYGFQGMMDGSKSAVVRIFVMSIVMTVLPVVYYAFMAWRGLDRTPDGWRTLGRMCGVVLLSGLFWNDPMSWVVGEEPAGPFHLHPWSRVVGLSYLLWLALGHPLDLVAHWTGREKSVPLGASWEGRTYLPLFFLSFAVTPVLRPGLVPLRVASVLGLAFLLWRPRRPIPVLAVDGVVWLALYGLPGSSSFLSVLVFALWVTWGTPSRLVTGATTVAGGPPRPEVNTMVRHEDQAFDDGIP